MKLLRILLPLALACATFSAPAAAQQAYFPGGVAKTHCATKTTIPGDTPCPDGSATAPMVTSISSSATSTGLLDSECSAPCASRIVTGAHNLYGFSGSATVAGWFLVYDATSCSADGTVTPLRAYAYPAANVTLAVSWSAVAKPFATGIAVCFSTTGPYTAATSTTAFVGVDYK